jgi:hypothetical protein
MFFLNKPNVACVSSKTLNAQIPLPYISCMKDCYIICPWQALPIQISKSGLNSQENVFLIHLGINQSSICIKYPPRTPAVGSDLCSSSRWILDTRWSKIEESLPRIIGDYVSRNARLEALQQQVVVGRSYGRHGPHGQQHSRAAQHTLMHRIHDNVECGHGSFSSGPHQRRATSASPDILISGCRDDTPEGMLRNLSRSHQHSPGTVSFIKQFNVEFEGPHSGPKMDFPNFDEQIQSYGRLVQLAL